MTYHLPEYYPHMMEYDEPYYCYVCGNLVADENNPNARSGKGFFASSEGVYHVIHYDCLNYYWLGHSWLGEKTLDEIRVIVQRYYIDHYIHYDWII